ncbi:MAG: ester cyclase [Chloroflexi bacterium]|nr:ester cyclase [Chloroflexota bacterium]MCI0579892.1 ester cyclase [Chloroflexota bacterium]MCI0646173.1 ester cyclase [Chloroflexota bacterium]MCI0729883.1 ester cyclase [Chloroflexota bacterium]
MSTDQIKALPRRVLESYNEGQEAARAVRREVYAPDAVFHFPGVPQPLDVAGHNYLVDMFAEAFRDDHLAVHDQVAEGDRVLTRWSWSFTHCGEFQGIPATGRRITISGMNLHRIRDGKIVEHIVFFDQISLLQQLGAIPAPEMAS